MDISTIKEINFVFEGALTKGDRRAATGVDLGEFNFDTTYGRNSLRLMYQHICIVSNTGRQLRWKVTVHIVDIGGIFLPSLV